MTSVCSSWTFTHPVRIIWESPCLVLLLLLLLSAAALAYTDIYNCFYSHRNVLCRLQCDSADGFIQTMIILKIINGVLNAATVSSMNNCTCVLYVCWHAVLTGPSAYMQRGWLIIEESWLRTLQGDVDERPNVLFSVNVLEERTAAGCSTNTQPRGAALHACMYVCMYVMCWGVGHVMELLCDSQHV